MRASFARLRSPTIRNNITPSRSVRTTAQATEAANKGRSRRKGSLERLIEIVIAAPSHQPSRFHISHQSGVERSGCSGAAAQRLGLTGQTFGYDRESAQQDTLGGHTKFVFDVGEGGVQYASNLFFVGLIERDAAQQLQAVADQGHHGQNLSGELGDYRNAVAMIEAQRGKAGGGDDAGMKTGAGEKRLVARDDFKSDGDRDHFDLSLG